MTTHRLKAWPAYFGAVMDGRKPFEARRVDPARTFLVGDTVHLVETTEVGDLTGRTLTRRITYVLMDFIPGWVILGLADPVFRTGAHSLADRLDGYGQGPAANGNTWVPASLIRETAFELRELAKDLSRLRDATNPPAKPEPPPLLTLRDYGPDDWP